MTLTLAPLPVATPERGAAEGSSGASGASGASGPGGQSGGMTAVPVGGERGEDDEGGAQPGIVIAGAAVAGAGLVAGVVFAVVANGAASDAEALRGDLRARAGDAACTGAAPPAECAELEDALGAKDTFGNAALWSFVGAGAIGAATLIYALAAPRSAQPTRGVRAAPWVSVGGGGMAVGGTW